GFARGRPQRPATAPPIPVTEPPPPLTGPPAPATGPQTPIDGVPSIAPVERRAVSRDGTTVAQPAVETLRTDAPGVLSPALAAAKAEIHAELLRRHAAAIDITNRAGIRRLLLQLTEDHFRAKPPAALVTADDRERLVDILFGDVLGLGPLEAPLRDPDMPDLRVDRPERLLVDP